MILGDVFDVNITALVTGLGIGGVAFALASKESLENLLGSFTIFFDKPFTVGDTVTLWGVTGTVEKVGFRSTRIRTFDKSVVTVPNKNIISTELDNLGARPVRRVKFNIGLTYDTSVDNIKCIVKDIQSLIDDHPMTNQDGRVRFLNFGASSLDIMVLYYVNSPDWEVLINAQQKINYDINGIVNFGYNKLILTPQNDDNQIIRFWDISIEGGKKELSSSDHFGNLVDLVSIESNSTKIKYEIS